MLLLLRKRWLDEFNLTGIMESLLVDEALMALYHQLRLNGLLAAASRAVMSDLDNTEGVQPYPVQDAQLERRVLLALSTCQQMIVRSINILYKNQSASHYQLRESRAGKLQDQHLCNELLQQVLR
jgi:hypothetical protein